MKILQGRRFICIQILICIAACKLFAAGPAKIVSCSPDTTKQNELLFLTISGSNTHFAHASGTIQVWLVQGSYNLIFNSAAIHPSSDSTINAEIDLPYNVPTGLWNLHLTEPVDGALLLNNALVIDSGLFIHKVSPNYGSEGKSYALTLTGYNTNFTKGSGTSRVWFSQGTSTINASNFIENNDSTITASFTIPWLATSGYWDVNATDQKDGTMSVPNGFFIIHNGPISITSVPDSAAPCETLSLTITGTNTNFMQGSVSAQLWLSQGTSTTINASSYKMLLDTVLNANFSIPCNADSGYYTVNIRDSYDVITQPNGIYITATAACNALFTWHEDTIPHTIVIVNKSKGLKDVWNFGDGYTLVGDTGSHTYATSGNYGVCLMVSDSTKSCRDSMCLDLNVLKLKSAIYRVIIKDSAESVPTGISKIHNESEPSFRIYPNPSAGLLNLDYQLNSDASVTYSICDLLGNCLFKSENQNKPTGNHQVQLNLRQFNAGMYVLRLNVNGQPASSRFVLTK